jgi:hypothetical protein
MTTTTPTAAPHGYRPDGRPKQHHEDDLNRPMRPNPWPGNPNAYPCPWGCNGTGSMPWFAHVEGGVCFACRGNGWILGRGLAGIPRRSGSPIAAATGSPRRWRKEGGRIVPA